MIFLYTFLIALFSPFLFLAFVWRFGLRKTLDGLPERLGMGAGPGGKKFAQGWIWIHAASVGEVKAAESFLKDLPSRFPGFGRLLTTTTVAGKELAEKSGLAECVRLAPVDLPFCVSRLLDRWRPRAVVLVETELWPNWLRGLAARRVPSLAVNGRVSDRSFPRYRLLRSFWGPLLRTLTRVGAQSAVDGERFVALGVLPERAVVSGNMKYDAPLPDLSRREAVRAKLGFLPSETVWVCGSTHPGEEDILADVLIRLRAAGRDVRMILAPRHIDRAAEVGKMLTGKGLPFAFRSTPAIGPATVVILDTLGELAEAYGAASFAFIGGSLIPRGGQNPLEPARWGVPVLFGPHMENFREMSDGFLSAGAAVRAADGQALEREVIVLLEDPGRRELLGRAAGSYAAGRRGAVEANMALLAEILKRPA
jgi:3-deoxy-D-manno-octulosonic-acid transferase